MHHCRRAVGILRIAAAAIAAAAVLLSSTASCQQNDEIRQLRTEVDELKREVQVMKNSPPWSNLDPTAHPPSEPRLEWGGFGEFTYQNFSGQNQSGGASGLRDQANLERLTVDGTYALADRIRLKFEFESLNAGVTPGKNNKGALDVEQAFIDFRLWKLLSVRSGLLLVPMGLINEAHRPSQFQGVFRPNVEQLILPTTWRELGAGAFGTWGLLSYRTYLMTGLSAVSNGSQNVTGFTGSTAIKGGRSQGALSFAENGAWTARVDAVPLPHFSAGGSIYIGQSGQDLLSSDVPMTLWDAHASADWRGAELRAVYAEGTIGDAGAVNQAQIAATPGFNDFAGRRFFGGYVSTAYDVFSRIQGGKQYLAPFFRYERYDTQSQVPRGYLNNAANSHGEYTLGLSYRPARPVTLKAEYQWLNNEARTGVNEMNMGLGYEF